MHNQNNFLEKLNCLWPVSKVGSSFFKVAYWFFPWFFFLISVHLLYYKSLFWWRDSLSGSFCHVILAGRVGGGVPSFFAPIQFGPHLRKSLFIPRSPKRVREYGKWQARVITSRGWRCVTSLIDMGGRGSEGRPRAMIETEINLISLQL